MALGLRFLLTSGLAWLRGLMHLHHLLDGHNQLADFYAAVRGLHQQKLSVKKKKDRKEKDLLIVRM